MLLKLIHKFSSCLPDKSTDAMTLKFFLTLSFFQKSTILKDIQI